MNGRNRLINNRWPIVLAVCLTLLTAAPAYAEGELTFVSTGGGEMDVTEDGHIICDPEAGWEVVSITSDSSVEGIEAGEQIPEDEIAELSFEAGATITAVFGWIGDDCLSESVPESAAAIF